MADIRTKWGRHRLPLLIPLLILLSMGAAAAGADSPHLTMGNPSNATPKTRDRDNYLMEKPYFALSYNNSKGTPNWVSWRLTAADLGRAPRYSFYPDQTLPDGFARILPADYTGSGFDRGHMCPHEDRSATTEMSEATFVMSNIIPQAKNVNEKAWAQLEKYCRDLVKYQKKTLYIICGPFGAGGQDAAGMKRKTIGRRHTVEVPAVCWKVIMVLDGGGDDDIARVNGHTRLIAVIMPNDETVGEDWTRYRNHSVKDVENLTGYKFFDKVPATIVDPLKQKPAAAPIRGH